MHRFLLAFILVLVAFPAATLNAQQAQDPQAVAVLHRSLAALGASGVASIKDTVVHATATPAPNAGGEAGTVTITTKGAYLFRSGGSGGSKNASVIYSGGRELRSSDKGWTVAASANAHHKRIEHLPALMLAYEIARGDLSAIYVGEETVETHPVHHIRLNRVSQRGDAVGVVLTGNSQLDVFIDIQTLLIVKISFPYMSEVDWRQSLPMEIYYDQYQTISGIAVPFHQRYFFLGKPISELQITSVAINQGIPDSTFEAK
jgi:hypothetical protein